MLGAQMFLLAARVSSGLLPLGVKLRWIPVRLPLWEPPQPPAHVDVAPPPPTQGGVEAVHEALRARRQLADIVRKNDEVLLALQLRHHSDDRTVIRALAKVNDLFELLRQAGCTIVQAARAEELMELAIEAPDVKAPKRSSARYFYAAAGLIVVMILVLVAIIVLEMSQAAQGWEVGKCSITLFHNQTCFQTPAERRGDFSPGWAATLTDFGPGDRVFLDTGCNDRQHHAVVVSFSSPSGVMPSSLQHDELCLGLSKRISPIQKHECRVTLQLGDHLLHAPRRRLLRVVSPTCVLVVHDTVGYRRLARTQVGQDDAVLEIGSSLGECTHILSSRASAVIGIDVSRDLVEESRRRFPNCRFEWLDCFQEEARLRALCKELLEASSSLKVFVDIGGDRTTNDVCCFLALLDNVLRTLAWDSLPSLPSLPSLVVVKSKALSGAAAEVAGPDGTIPAPKLRPWLEACTIPPVVSSKQLKKKMARARKAQWQQADDSVWQAFEMERIQWDILDDEDPLMFRACRRVWTDLRKKERAHLKAELQDFKYLKQEQPEA
ncbi:unnamed protein product [Symbiodinium natans]|uniref:Methyltransferase domain-containing protein n=1 Tax=Symbiodinium natans TaxID=878477 RepID=A0A812UVZ5_9DINO|nr:unnamed protein product [Symbiodinium natans]